MRKIERISIGSADRERQELLVRDRNTPQKVVWRARIVLLAGDGAEGIAAAVGKSLLTIRRYIAKGVDGLLKGATRPSRVKPLSPEKVTQVVHMTLHEKPPNATHWSLRSMAAAAGISYSSVFLQNLQHAFDAGELRFFGNLAGLAAPTAFAAGLDQLRRIEWVVYAKPPFGGPEQVLAYLGR